MLKWTDMIHQFYDPFHKNVEDTLENSERASGERELGYDPESGKVSVEPVSKNNPDSLKAPDSPDSAPAGPTQAERSGENNGNISSINSAKASEPNYSMDAATRLTTTAPCPSFGRAMSAAQFGKSGSHFDAGAIGLK
jgi:hypothetical protein